MYERFNKVIAIHMESIGMIDHTGFVVKNAKESKAFYEPVLATLGFVCIADFGVWFGFGRDGKADFWFGEDAERTPASSTHVAFKANSIEEVQAFYDAALKAGGKDNGRPGYRPQYHEKYYGAFVFDLDGNNIEAVFHG